MPRIGKINTLTIQETSPHGLYLDGETLGSILLPNRYVPAGSKPGETLEVFIHLDSEDRLVATTEKPAAQVGEFALLKVAAITNIGAFLDWGLSRDLFVPFREQRQKMEEGRNYLVYVYLDDETKRIAASAKIEKFLDNVSPPYKPGDKVDLTIIGPTDIGYKAIINNTHTGLIYKNETETPFKTGERMPGYIKRIRGDEKIDLATQPLGLDAIKDISEQLLARLRENQGFLPLTDHSSPEEIKLLLGVSKKAFKKATGTLYKQGKIRLEKEGLRLVAR
jgi:hypothetical protein